MNWWLPIEAHRPDADRGFTGIAGLASTASTHQAGDDVLSGLHVSHVVTDLIHNAGNFMAKNRWQVAAP